MTRSSLYVALFLTGFNPRKVTLSGRVTPSSLLRRGHAGGVEANRRRSGAHDWPESSRKTCGAKATEEAAGCRLSSRQDAGAPAGLRARCVHSLEQRCELVGFLEEDDVLVRLVAAEDMAGGEDDG